MSIKNMMGALLDVDCFAYRRGINMWKLFGSGERDNRDTARGGSAKLSPDVRKIIETLDDQNDHYMRVIDRMSEDLNYIKSSVRKLHFEVMEIKNILEPQLRKEFGLATREDSQDERGAQRRPLGAFQEGKKTLYSPFLTRQRSLNELLDAYNTVNTQNRVEVDEFLRDWNCRKFEIDDLSSLTNKILFKEKEMGNFLAADVGNLTYILPNFFSQADSVRIVMLKKCYEIQGDYRFEIGDKYSIVKPATAVMANKTFTLRDKGVIEILRAPEKTQENEEPEKGRIKEFQKPGITEISIQYNKALRDETLRSKFLESYRAETTPLNFKNISFQEEDHYWVFPMFDQIVSGPKIADSVRKFFIVPSEFIRMEEIEEITPAKISPQDGCLKPGEIKIKAYR